MQPRQGGGVTLVRPNSAAPGNYVRQGLTRLDANWGSGRNSQLPDGRRMGRGANSLNGQPTEHFPMAPRAPLRAQHDLRVTGSGRGAAVGQQERGTKTAPHASRQRPPVSEDWVRGLLPSPGRQAGGHPAEAAPDWSPVMMRPSTADASRSSGLGGLVCNDSAAAASCRTGSVSATRARGRQLANLHRSGRRCRPRPPGPDADAARRARTRCRFPAKGGRRPWHQGQWRGDQDRRFEASFAAGIVHAESRAAVDWTHVISHEEIEKEERSSTGGFGIENMWGGAERGNRGVILFMEAFRYSSSGENVGFAISELCALPLADMGAPYGAGAASRMASTSTQLTAADASSRPFNLLLDCVPDTATPFLLPDDDREALSYSALKQFAHSPCGFDNVPSVDELRRHFPIGRNWRAFFCRSPLTADYHSRLLIRTLQRQRPHLSLRIGPARAANCRCWERVCSRSRGRSARHPNPRAVTRQIALRAV